MLGWPSRILKVAAAVIVLDLVAGALSLLDGPAVAALLGLTYTLAVAGVGWLIASHMVLHHLEGQASSPPADEVEEEAVVGQTPPSALPRPSELPQEPLRNRPWLTLVEACTELVEELDRAQEIFDPARQELARHVLRRLEEILGQPGVEIISGDELYAPDRHRPDPPAAVGEGRIAETLSPGFAVGRRVLRRARVRLEI